MNFSALFCSFPTSSRLSANTQISREEGERPVMANYTPSLIIPLSRLFQTSPKNTEGTREEEEEGEREGGGRRTRERKGRK